MRRPAERRRRYRDPERASTTLPQSDLGRFDPMRVHDTRPLKHWQEKREEQSAQTVALLNLFEQMSASMGGLLVLTRAAAPGDAIGTGTLTIGTAGVNQRSFPARFQAVGIANQSGMAMTVTNAPAASQAPTVGAGVYVIPPNTYRVIPLRGTVVTVYGVTGSSYDLTVYAKPRSLDFSAAPGAGDGVIIPAGATTTQTVLLKQGFGHIAVVQNVQVAGGGTLQVTLNGVTPSGYVYPILVGTAVSAVGSTPLRVGPALTPSPNAVANDLVPRELQIVATVTGAITYGLDYVGNA